MSSNLLTPLPVSVTFQDTVVALQALAMFASATYSPEGDIAVTVHTSELVAQFEVNERNRLLYQEKELFDIPANHTIRAEGEGCVLAQVTDKLIAQTYRSVGLEMFLCPGHPL